MSTFNVLPDIPVSYPMDIGAKIHTGVTTTPEVIGVFYNTSQQTPVTALLQSLHFSPHNASADTLVTLQLVSGATVQGGTFEVLPGSVVQVKSSGYISAGAVAMTLYSNATAGHGNTPPSASFANEDAASNGLYLAPGQTFAIVASTTTVSATVDIAWSVNWVEQG
jgi:hypothetical protein